LRILRRPRAHVAWLAPLLLAAGMGVAFVRYTWLLPHYSAVKASYMLPALLPASYVLAQGLVAFGGLCRTVLRALLLLIAGASTLLTWWGWWTW
jgi:hypothetical protein